MGAILALPVLLIGILPLKSQGIFYYIKWIIAYIYIEICRRLTTKRLDLYDITCESDPEKLMYIVPKKEYQLESTYDESHLLKARDEILFYGVNSKNERLILSVCRRCNQKADVTIYLKLASGKTYTSLKTTDYQLETSEDIFSAGGLQLNYLVPMRKWRLFFNGALKLENDDPSIEKVVYVKFAFIWTASSNIFDFYEDVNSKMLANYLAETSWSNFTPPFKKMRNVLNSYSQSGVSHGTVTIEDEAIDYEMYLFGQRIRNMSSTVELHNAELHHLLGYIPKDGTFIHVCKFSAPSLNKSFNCGYVIHPSSVMEELRQISLQSETEFPNVQIIKGVLYTNKSFTFNGLLESSIESGSEKSSHDRFSCLSFDLNGNRGYGFSVIKDLKSLDTRTSSMPIILTSTKNILTVPFTDDLCQLSEVTGGKGSSLGKLTHFSQKIQTFVVPDGLVVTSSAYRDFITPEVLIAIKNLENVLYGNKVGNVKEKCQKLSKLVEESKYPNKIELSLIDALKDKFKDTVNSSQFAIRSSAIGEDSEQMSAAGQMETFLGVSGVHEILKAIKKCWASQFNFVPVQYKRRYGQLINSPMAVVVQKMVSCDVAGVLFSCDPLTGNPTLMTITANYGLGESVVSASEEPDTIVLNKEVDDKLCIKEILLGAKSHKIVTTDKGTIVEDVPEKQRIGCCLTEQMILRLGYLAMQIENFYHSPRDIEWGFYNNNLYIFQSRPVTSGSGESIFEIEHEFDAPLRIENDYFTISNVGEVMPGAFTPLGFAVFLRTLVMASTKEMPKQFKLLAAPKYYQHAWTCFYHHFLMNVVDVFPNIGEKDDAFAQASHISFFGRIIDDNKLNQIALDRYGEKPLKLGLGGAIQLFKNMFFSRGRLKRALKNLKEYRIPIEKYTTATDLFHVLITSCLDTTESTICHIFCTQASMLWNVLVFSTIAKAEGEYNDRVYRDFANLLKTCDKVESADVPSAMQSLACNISRATTAEGFKKFTPTEALEWLRTSPSKAGELFRIFLEKHGHRCFQEFDLFSHPWGTSPEPLVKLLQNLVGSIKNDVSEKESTNLWNILSTLTVPLGILSKLKLRFCMPFSRRSVQDRENSKSLMVKSIDAFRKGYWRLAEMMVSEGRLPQKEMLFFLTLEEIRDVLETRSPKLVSRAAQRYKHFPVLNTYLFPEIFSGLPKPLNREEDISDINIEDNLTMKGIPVSQGIAKGFIRKALTVEEAESLKPGEILLTRCTDIGWTPYFPSLAGVVTELGGLISHGAVVSREYGIPCIAGMQEATRHFRTGDYALLDGNKGTLQKLSPPEN